MSLVGSLRGVEANPEHVTVTVTVMLLSEESCKTRGLEQTICAAPKRDDAARDANKVVCLRKQVNINVASFRKFEVGGGSIVSRGVGKLMAESHLIVSFLLSWRPNHRGIICVECLEYGLKHRMSREGDTPLLGREGGSHQLATHTTTTQTPEPTFKGRGPLTHSH